MKVLVIMFVLLNQFILNSEAQNSSKDPNSFTWKHATPESVGVSSKTLDSVCRSLIKKNTDKLVIIKSDKIIYEWYVNQQNDFFSKHYCASMAKAVVSGLSLLSALDKKYLYPDAPAAIYIPSWKKDPVKSKISIRQLATHSSGLEDASVSIAEQVEMQKKGLDAHSDLSGWKGQFWSRNPDPFLLSRDSAKIIAPPGTKYIYSNSGIAMLNYAITNAIDGSPYENIRDMLETEIYKKIGMTAKDWDIGYGTTYKLDGLSLVAGWGGGNFNFNALCRIARFMLRKGNWQGKQIIDSALINSVIRYDGTPLPPNTMGESIDPALTMGWYSNNLGTWKYIPKDAFAAGGAGSQLLLVVPSLQLIVVRNGEALYDIASTNQDFWGAAVNYLFNPIISAINEPPYPKSKLIREVSFAPENEIVRMADGSDNWPLTWADDNQLYTAYGDGNGFDATSDLKLSLGLAKITGMPPNIKGQNIRSPGCERVGEDVRGAKASGLLMIDGILYMLTRNVGIAQLGWSVDQGKTWQWANWKFDQHFGCPTFLNFGKNYNGSRDNYVYIYSHDESSAYKVSDQMLLARVNKTQLRNFQNYEYFAGDAVTGKAKWTNNLSYAKPVFSNPAKCYRSAITYDKGIRRYLWTQIIPRPGINGDDNKDPRFQGGLGIFEAPEPWGPWSTVYYQLDWDTGPGETGSIPPKWLSADGTTGYYLFSGNDCLSIRKFKFILNHDHVLPKN